jgi:ribosomal protein S18 acetylase RimI-like enzyme
MKIIQASRKHVEAVAELFDLYRQFYGQPADYARAEDFIRQRIAAGESTIFLAVENGQAAGFTQLYPSFCSVEAVRIQILYDLFVKDGFRRRGVAEALMKRAAEFARDSGARRIDLLTGVDNVAGQALYEKIGYRRQPPEFFPYSLEV